MLFGHLCGDYLFQNHYMALNKSKNTLNGWFAAIIHCLIYTLAVCTFMWNFDVKWIIIVFFSHFFIDKFALGEHWMHYIKGYGLKDFIGKDNANANLTRNDIIEGGFMTLIYAVTDNTMHLIIMFGAYKLIY